MLVGDQNSLIETCLVNRLAYPAKRFEPLLTTLTLTEEVPDSLFNHFIGASITP